MKNSTKNNLGIDDNWARLRRNSPPVTAVIGFVCSDAIVLASDSQMTSGDTKLSLQKIHHVKFANGMEAVFAFAGQVDGATIFKEIFERNALITQVNDWRDMANCAELSIKEARTKILDGFRHDSLTAEQSIEHLNEHYCEIVLAYCYEFQPYIFRLNLKAAIAIKCDGDFVAIGSAGNIAALTLTGFELRALEITLAVALAIYVIEICKRADLYCSGLSQVGWATLSQELKVSHIEKSTLLKLQDAANRIHSETQKDLGLRIIKEFALMIGITGSSEPTPPAAQSPAAEPSTTPLRELARLSAHPIGLAPLPPGSSPPG